MASEFFHQESATFIISRNTFIISNSLNFFSVFNGCFNKHGNFRNLGLALGMSLKFYTSVAKELKLEVRKKEKNW